MKPPCRPWWRNCALEADSEMLQIDRLEDELAPLSPDAARIRELISALEVCHHKAARWIENIVEAIGLGETQKGLGTRPAGRLHPAEEVWQSVCAVLSAWCSGSAPVALCFATVPSRMLDGLGNRCALKEWQVHRVVERVRSLVGWPGTAERPAPPYEYLLFGGPDGSLYRSECPEAYLDHADFWLATVRTLIRDTDGGSDATLPLGLAIDMLWPCHWNFPQNLQIVLDAIGGNLAPENPFAACGRNIGLLRNRGGMEVIAGSLRAYSGLGEAPREVDGAIVSRLGEPTAEKRWLAASLDKTIRLQLDPPSALRAISSLSGPDWIRQV